MAHKRVVLMNKERQEVIGKARAKKSRREAAKKDKTPLSAAKGLSSVEAAGFMESVKDMAAEAVTKAEELVNTAVEKIKVATAEPALPPAASKKNKGRRKRTQSASLSPDAVPFLE